MRTTQHDVNAIREQARGRWRKILTFLGIEIPAKPTAHGPCPVCGRKDRFRHELKHIGRILRRLRVGCETQMTPDFNLPLSLLLDDLVQQEEALGLLGEEGRA